MNGNAPSAQDYGQALDAAIGHAIRYAPKNPRELFEWALDTAADGGASVSDLLDQFAETLTSSSEFATGIARREGME